MDTVTGDSSLLVKRLFTIAVLVAGVFPAHAQMARSISYELDYAVVGAASALTQSENQSYEITGLVTMEGLAGGTAASDSFSYTISPLIGEALENNSSIELWSLY